MNIPLGSTVKCRVTGFTGVAENRAAFMYGCDRYFVQPTCGDDGKMPDGAMIDHPQLEILNEGKQVMEPLHEPPCLVEMGQSVEDPIRGQKGIVTGRAVYLNGCSRVLVTPKHNPNNAEGTWWVDEKQVVGKKTIAGSAKVKVTPDTSNRYGGPAPSSSKY